MPDVADAECRLAIREIDLFERSHGAVRLRIEVGRIAVSSLETTGYASGALPERGGMRRLATGGS
mgnify:CR=1 FL=1